MLLHTRRSADAQEQTARQRMLAETTRDYEWAAAEDKSMASNPGATSPAVRARVALYFAVGDDASDLSINSAEPEVSFNNLKVQGQLRQGGQGRRRRRAAPRRPRAATGRALGRARRRWARRST